jgi:hypothetical protein
MLLLRETHEVIGAKESSFEATMRDEWMPAVASNDDARLLYYLNLAVGSGRSYQVVCYTLFRDAAAWGRLVDRVNGGDLASLSRKLDEARHDVRGTHYVPLPWSPIQEIALEEVPVEPSDHELSLFMEDTVWPHEGKLEQYVERAGAHYAVEFDARSTGRRQLLEIQGAYRTAFGGRRRREIVLWQKVMNPKGMVGLLTREIPKEYKTPGRWMVDGLEFRDQWQSRLLRTTSWSPLF